MTFLLQSAIAWILFFGEPVHGRRLEISSQRLRKRSLPRKLGPSCSIDTLSLQSLTRNVPLLELASHNASSLQAFAAILQALKPSASFSPCARQLCLHRFVRHWPTCFTRYAAGVTMFDLDGQEAIAKMSEQLAKPETVEQRISSVIEEIAKDGINRFSPEGASLAETEGAKLVETAVLDSIGQDLLIFLTAFATATPISRILNVSPIVVYLIVGAILGPHGIGILQSSEADVELGDFGILFLLFEEGLEVTTELFQQRVNYLPLALAQVSLTTAILCLAILGGAGQALEAFLPLDKGLIDISNPREALVLALVGSLSTSASIIPVVEERGWEEKPSGIAASSVLLFQDLLVAPLLVLLPFIVGKGVTDTSALVTDTSAFIELGLKATLGFTAVVAAGSFLLQKFFEVVVKFQSSDLFVALSLLVAVGMGAVAKSLGLAATIGAFAAGVLLANSNFKYEISAAIAPFRGILLGCFFLTAGSEFDFDMFVSEWPTILTGVTLLVLLKALTLGTTAQIDRFLPSPSYIPPADIVRLSLLLAGGGELAFVVLQSAENLGLTPQKLDGVLKTIIIISMALTPSLGDAAEALSKPLVSEDERLSKLQGAGAGEVKAAADAIVICGYGLVGSTVSQVIEIAKAGLADRSLSADEALGQKDNDLPSIVCFDLNPSRLPTEILKDAETLVLYGDGANGELLRSVGVTSPRAIIITYNKPERRKYAVQRLRLFFPDVPIYTRSSGREEREALIANGATETVDRNQELALQLSACLVLDQDDLQIGEGDVLEETASNSTKREMAVRALRCAVLEDNTTFTPQIPRLDNS